MKVFINGKEIRYILITRNLSQGRAAERIGITRTHFNRLLHGDSTPSPTTRDNILKVFRGISWDKLFKITSTTVNL
ncbi:MAG: helix-turn-helix transcriptional regulator [Elusimicrobiales bacterium]|nr:helix-turn-helix transcriptional regulator [Elusimicrobiales bacterium]